MRYTEPAIKVNLIRWLESKGYLDNAVLINELPVANLSRTSFARRVDIAVANGSLLGFEIKSEFDSLERLEGQVKLYLERFDKVFVVCAPKFTKKVVKLLPTNAAVIEFREVEGGMLDFKVIKRGRKSLKTNSEQLLSFVNKKEILSELKRRGVYFDMGISRLELYKLCDRAFTVNELRRFSIDCVKASYKQQYDLFKKNCSNYTESELSLLTSKANQNQVIENKATSDEDEAFILSVLAKAAKSKMQPIKRLCSS